LIQHIDSVLDIAAQFDGFMIDQYGVLHDGHTPYPNAVAILRALKQQNKPVIIMSNSGKRSSANRVRMTHLGFTPDLYSHFVTSGDVAHQRVQEQSTSAQPQRCLLIARDNDQSAIEGLHLELVEQAAQAQLVIIAGSKGDIHPQQYYKDLLKEAASQRIPCLCTNPDKLMLTTQGLSFGAGQIAQWYEQMGGVVQWIGKPYPEIYRFARQFVSTIDSDKILCIGDSLEHDIRGGCDAGMKTLFVKGGIHESMQEPQLSEFMTVHHAYPDYQIPLFQ